MTVCIAASNYPPQTGGIATCYGHLAALLVKEGHRVIVLVPGYEQGGEEDEVKEENGVTIITLHAGFQSYRKEYAEWFPDGGLDAPTWIAAGLAMRDWIRANSALHKIDLIETGDYGGLGAFFVEKNMPPVAVTGHGTFIQLSRYNFVKEDLHTKIIRELELCGLQKADSVIAHSRLSQDEMRELSSRETESATIPWQKNIQLPVVSTESFALVAGGLQKVKGAITMVEAVELLSASTPAFRLCWAGGDTFTAPGAKKMSGYLAKKNPATWGRQFNWLNELTHEEVKQKIASCMMVIIPSEWEAFNYVVLEAASMGKPIVMTDKVGGGFLFTNKKDALIVPAGDAGKLAEAIRELWHDEQLRDTIGKAAAETVFTYFQKRFPAMDRNRVYTYITMYPGKRRKINADEILIRYKKPSRRLYYRLKRFIKKITGR